MRFQICVMTKIRQVVTATIATAVLAVAFMAPAVHADPGPDSDDRSLTTDEIEFLENNWHLDSGVVMLEEDSTEGNPGNPALSRDEIRFLEDNWNLTAEDVFGSSNSEDNPGGGSESDLWLLEEPRMQMYHE